MAKNNNINTAVDVGYGYTKATIGTTPLVFPSVYVPAHDKSFTSSITGASESWELTIGKRRFLVGDLATRQAREPIGATSRQRVFSEEMLVYTLMALCKLVPGGGGVNLVTGLPHDWLKDKNRLAEALRGRHKVTLGNNGTWTYSIDNVVVIPQAFGTLAGRVFEYNGHGFAVRDKRLLVEPSITIDFGRLTVGFMLYQDREYQDNGSGSITMGMIRAIEGLRRDIFNKHDLQLSATEVDQALQRGYITVYGKQHSIKALAQPYLEEIVEHTFSKAWTLWDDGRRYPHLPLTGGGAILLGDMFNQRYQHPGAVIVPAPQLANVEGMLVYCRWLASSRGW